LSRCAEPINRQSAAIARLIFAGDDDKNVLRPCTDRVEFSRCRHGGRWNPMPAQVSADWTYSELPRLVRRGCHRYGGAPISRQSDM